MKLLGLTFLLLFSLRSFAVCMTEIDADAYGCVSMHDNAFAVKWCEDKHGKSYKPYYTDNVCSKELAYTLRGENYTSSSTDAQATAKAACMTYEQGMKNNCQYYDFEAAQRYCAANYGNRYIPFIPDDAKCSLANASKLRGEVSGEVLVKDLPSALDEIETIMTMIDREGLNNSLGGFESKKPKIGNEFYTDVVKALMAKMNMFKQKLYENGQHNVPIDSPQTIEYLKHSFRYLSVLGRLFKVYAHVAHENHYALKTYSFKNLEYLNLTLKKEHALEILAQVNYRAKTVSQGKDIEFIIGQQERQTFEYMAMQDPNSKIDYAKLVSFLGIRENVTNLWGVQRMSPDMVANERTRSCGNFLSFRPKSGSMAASAAYTELFEYDVFYNDYVPRWENMVELSEEVSLLDERKAMDLGDYVFRNVEELKNLLENELAEPVTSREGFRQLALQDAPMLMRAENENWREFAYNHFSTVVMPGDDVLDKDAVIGRIAEEAYYKRLEAVVDVFIASYLWVSDAAVDEMENKIRRFSDQYLKESFMRRMSAKLAGGMDNYYSREALAQDNRKAKIKTTLEAAKSSVVAVNVLDAIKNESLDYSKMNTLEPTNLEELMLLFQDRVESDFSDLRETLEHNEELAKELNSFFTEVAQEFKEEFIEQRNGQSELKGSLSERVKGLRKITFEVAKKWHQKYPYTILNNRTRAFFDDHITVAADNTRVARNRTIPVFQDGTAAAMNNQELLENLPKLENMDRYVMPADNTRVYLGATPRVDDRIKGGDSGSSSPQSRDNADKLTTGAISRPLEVVSPGKIATERGEIEIDNNKLSDLFRSFDILSERAKESLKNSRQQVMPDQNVIASKNVINEPHKFFFRVFEALRLSDVGMRDADVGRFARDEQAQALLAQNLVSQAYQVAPILRNEYTWKKKIKKYCFTGANAYRCDQEKTVTAPLLEKIGLSAYSRETNKLNGQEARRLVNETVDKAIKNTPNKVSKFCNANYLNYKNDPNYKDVFAASKFLRNSLRTPMGQSEAKINKIAKFDEEIHKELRSKWQRWNEDYFEPALIILGTAAIVSLAIVMIVGTGGAAAPGIMGGVISALSTFVAIEFFVSFPLVMGSLYARINTHFIEVPSQLKFQESLASSQVDFAKVVDWDMLKDEKKANKSSRAWTIGLMPLDFFYGAALARHVQKEAGVVGRAAFQRMTGTKLRGWSAPPKSMLKHPRFSQLRSEMGLRKALGATLKNHVRHVKSYLPKYQAIPEQMIKSSSLRIGIARKAESLNITRRPWVLLEDIKAHTGKLKGRLRHFEEYVQAEARVAQKIRLNTRLKGGEIFQHFKETAVYFVPSSLWKRVKNKDIQGVKRFFTNFGEVWSELKTAQGTVINSRVKSVEAVGDKLQDFQRGVGAGHYKGDNLMSQFLETLSDKEILALEEVAKKSNGVFRNFKSVFKDHKKIIQGLRPMSYLAGYPGQSFGAQAAYSQTFLLDGKVDPNYAFKSDAEDLVNFYESMVKHNAVKNEQMSQTRERVEDALGRKIRNDNGDISSF